MRSATRRNSGISRPIYGQLTLSPAMRAASLLNFTLGEPPPARPPEPGSAGFVLFVCSAAALGMELALKHALKMDDPMGMAGWRYAAHGALPLLALAAWQSVRLRRSRLAVVLACPLVLAPLAAGTFGRMPALIADWRWLVIPTLAGVTLLAAAMRYLEPERFGLTMGDWRWWAPRTAAFVVIVVPSVTVFCFLFPSLIEYYPVWDHADHDARLLAHETIAVGLDMLSWEFLFRGVLLFACLQRGDWLTAVLIQSFPFFILHYRKPEPELIAAWAGGVAAGMFAIRARSFWPLWIMHWTQLAWMSTLGFLAING